MQRINLNNIILVLIAAFTIVVAPIQIQAQELPEHPKKDDTKKSESTLSPEALSEEIEKYVQNESKTEGGYFLFYDEKTKSELKLTLDKVHKDKLSKVAEGLYFACSDYKSTDGKTYDLDFFMKETDSGLEVTQQLLHKVDGKARYSWYEEEGVWKQQQK